MRKEYIIDELTELHSLIDEINKMPESRCFYIYEKSKEDAIEQFEKEIASYKEELEELEEEEDDGMDYAALQYSQGLPIVHW